MSNHPNRNRNTAKQALREILEMPWIPNACIGYNAEQLELIRIGFNSALNEAYRIAYDRKQIKPC